MSKKVIMTVSLLILITIPSAVLAAPAITNIGGSVSHGQAITITGSGFGTHPNYNAGSYKWQGSTYLLASFKDNEDNLTTSQGFSSSHISDISLLNGGPSNSTRYSQIINNGSDTPAYGITQSGNNAQSVYTSFWFMMPTGTSGGKPWRWYFGPNSSNDNLYLAVNCGSNLFTMQGDLLAQNNIGAIYGPSFTYNAWHKVEILASQPIGVYTIWLDGALYLDYTTEKGVNPWSYTHTMSPNGHTVEVPDMIDGTGRGCSVAGSYNYDDYYIDYTPARVEICNGSTWATRGICNTQIPTNWSASSIGIVVNQGTFTAGSSKYLYVVDSNNTANSSGTQIQFGSGGGGTTDTTAPTASISIPASGTTVSGTTAITVSASDNIGASKVELYVDGTLSATDTASPYTFSWNTAAVTNGSHTLSAKAYDAAGNMGTSASITVTVSNSVVDTTTPTVSISSPTGGTTVSSTLIVSASASDNVGVSKVEFYLDSATTPAATITSSPYTFSWNTTSVASGTHTINAKAYDAANNIGQSATVSFTINNTYSVPAGTVPRSECSSPPTGTVFCEDFEGTNPKTHFDDYDGNPDTENLVVTDNGPSGDPSNKEIRLRVPAGQGGVSDLLKVLPAAYDKLYARWYFKYEPGFNFSVGNHGGGLAAGNRSYVGRSGIRPNGDDYAGFYIQYQENTANPYAYSYYRGMYQDCSDPNGSCWGDSLPCVFDNGAFYCTKQQDRPSVTLPTLVAGQWYCVEEMVDMGTPSADGQSANGRLTLWLDSNQLVDNQNLWLRTTASLKIQNIWMSLFFGDGTHSTVGELIDNLVVSTQRIGCGSAFPPAPRNLIIK